ncbi:MAG: DNA-binding response regulator [Chitinophagales bacterium]|nr:MAG: DNA-binding response regulator [Chitinophagales bacterium]
MQSLSILIADDHPLFRSGIRQILSDEKFERIDEASNGKEVIEKLKNHKYDIVIMDIKMPEMNGIEATRIIRKKFPHVKVLALSMYDDQPYILKIIKAGARGYLLKNTGKEELLNAIHQLMAGKNYFSKEISGVMMEQIVSGKPLPYAKDTPEQVTLTRREKEIIRMIAEEYTNVEIGKHFGISPRTVDTHRRNLLQKLKVKNTAGLVKYAMKNNLLD